MVIFETLILISSNIMKKGVFVCILLFITLLKSFGQLPLTRDTLDYILRTSPAFTIFKDNYFITGTTLNNQPSKFNSDVKFQISFKQRLINNRDILGFYPYLSYTQKSFWNIYQNSSPFAESNYNPSIFILKPIFKQNYVNGFFILSIEHESNGRDSTNGSKSWNYMAVNYMQIISPKLYISLKIWAPYGLNDNTDLMRYSGYGETSLYWVIKENRFLVEAIARKGATWDFRGSLQINLAYHPFKNRNQYIMLQWFNGYAENLIDYKENRNMLRIGLMLKPSFYKFY
jgi:phospholipase A1